MIFGELAQLVRAFGSHPRGRRFESFTPHLEFECTLKEESTKVLGRMYTPNVH